ncbi:asparaginase domain-containing protein [Trichoderma breve]|uniref:Asparaginase domain-containing protein n=1 Tax=Trichoderma breve TaxID=2034170 RepID=A0A9W9B4T9_9HYPO|nr:asparaginase domain-containing protein [Trichoderma breve]KAJ4855797.1 asparaginase domain-containing protein [Trichoderma breve]
MEYKQQHSVSDSQVKIQPRLIIHGGAGNILRSNFPADKYAAYRSSLLSIVSKTRDYMNSPTHSEKNASNHHPSALEIATHAVAQLEDNPLFNSGHGAVFTRDGINELEASVMVSRGFKKRGVGVMGLRRVRNPILLARKMLEHGERDLAPAGSGHTQLHGQTAEQLAQMYGLEMVDPKYFFTQQRWDEHVRALEREQKGLSSGTWHAEEYLPQGTCGAVALDADGVICAATSTGGMTNKLTGRIGDTPVVGAGFWAEEWDEEGLEGLVEGARPGVSFVGPLKGLLADCFPTPWMYSPAGQFVPSSSTRSMGFSGTGNGDSFLRVNAVRTVAAIARYKPLAGNKALARVAGPGGELQKSAGDRWGRTGEGEGGIIGIECVLERDEDGGVVGVKSEVLMEYNCGGMYRAWIDDDGEAVMSIWSNGSADEL